MSSIPSGFPISLKAWPSKSSDAVDLSTFFQRVNAERGGLTKITEASLREEIFQEELSQAAKSQAGEVATSDDVEMQDAEEKEPEEKGKLATKEELLAMLAYVP